MMKLRIYAPPGVSLEAAISACQSASRFFAEWDIEIHSESGEFEPTIAPHAKPLDYGGSRSYSVQYR